MKRKAHTVFACDVCSREEAPVCFMSDTGLARHKRSASHLRQHQAALALQRYNSAAAAAAASTAAHANGLPMQVEHGPHTP